MDYKKLEKTSKVQRILTDYSEMERRLFDEFSAKEPHAGRARWQAQMIIRRERLADLQALLGPVEGLDMEMQFSSPGREMRSNLRGLKVSPEEQLTVYQLVNEFAELHGYSGPFTPAESAVRERARLGMYDGIREVLGEERAVVYFARDDLDYRRLTELAEDLGTSHALGEQVWRLRSELIVRRGDLFTAAGNKPPEPEALAALYQEIHTRTAALVGTKTIAERGGTFEWLTPGQ